MVEVVLDLRLLLEDAVDLLAVLVDVEERDAADRNLQEALDFTCVYEEGGYGFSYIKRFRFGGLIRNKDYWLAPEKPKSKILLLQKGCPETLYVKFKPAKGQKIHQQYFQPRELVSRVNRETGKSEQQEVVPIRTATTKGKQLTTKPIARVSGTKGTWWDDGETPSKGVLD